MAATNELDARLAEYAVAVRMTCCNPDRAGDVAQPVSVSLCEAAGQADQHVLSFPSDVTTIGLVDALAADICSRGELPAAVVVDGVGVFRIDADATAGRVAGCVAIVTGSGQGFGRGIAEELAREGAHVVVADLNAEMGTAAAEALTEAYGPRAAVFVQADVADLTSQQACVQRAVMAFGGVDMFVSNAGVLKAGGIDAMSEADFDLVTRVNYKGYFLGVKAVTPVMQLQHQLHAGHFMDIIQVNSKSGLSGSNRNFAYAGGKFGGIGLTQSFALELVSSNIRVNAVCPGNFFDGPLWSDPQKGLFVKYLDAGKVPGAETVEDVRRFYLDKVPMRRGCLPADVAKAIFYVHEQTYETGQAIPVTGGQEMLK